MAPVEPSGLPKKAVLFGIAVIVVLIVLSIVRTFVS